MLGTWVGAMLGKIPAVVLGLGSLSSVSVMLMACFMDGETEVRSVRAQAVHALDRACVGLPLQSNVVWDSGRHIFPATSSSPWLLLSTLFLGSLLG